MKKNVILIFVIAMSIFSSCELENKTEEQIFYPEGIKNIDIEPRRRPEPPTPRQVGGSNYPMFDTQGYQDTGVWSSPDNLKLVIGHYHLNPNKINSQLQAMYQNGQRKIALLIWFSHFPDFLPNTNTHKHLIRSNLYRLPDQQEQNLKDILQEIKRIGYNEVIIRFAQQWLANPGEWTSWNETQFQENWNFIYNTINTSESVLGSPATIQRVYDLGAELGGLTRGQTITYVDKLWRNFSFRFPTVKSSGYSIAYAPGRLDRLIKTLKKTGRTPNEYAIDIYDNLDTGLRRVSNELRANAESNKFIVIQETYYNNRSQYTALINSIKKYHLNTRYIMQWPRRKNAPRKHFSENFPEHYGNYLPLNTN